MKELTVIRHAKSSWNLPDQDDYERPLNERGARDVPEMGRRLAASGGAPDRFIASTALRARQTAEGLVAALGADATQITWDRDLYLASAKQLLEAVRALDDTIAHAAIVAHNPGITELVNRLADVRIDNVPTCGIAHLRLDIPTWPQASWKTAHLVTLDYPKRTA